MLDITANPWSGNFKKIFSADENTIKVDFSGNDGISLKLSLEYPYADYFNIEFANGSYYIDSNHYLTAKLTEDRPIKDIGNTKNSDAALWDGIANALNLDDKSRDDFSGIRFKLELKGYMYWYNDKNKGTYWMTVILTKTDGTVIEKTVKNDWELSSNTSTSLI
jgi:hypothetical protein